MVQQKIISMKKIINELTKFEFKKRKSFTITSINLIRNFRNRMAHSLNAIVYKNPYYLDRRLLIEHYSSSKILSWKDVKNTNRFTNDMYSLILCILMYLDDSFMRLKFIDELYNVLFSIENTALFHHYSEISGLPKNLNLRLMELKQFYKS